MPGLNTDDFPVESVTWDQAREFCNKAEKILDDGQQYRLPTEAEWEYACRGGASSKDSFPFYLKNGPTASLSGGQINFDGNFPYGNGKRGQALGRTARCGSFPDSVNELGLYDMHGNVWQYCSDWYREYPTERVTDPTGPLQGSGRVIRGGGWNGRGQDCRAAYRSGIAPPAGTSASASGLPGFPSGSKQESEQLRSPKRRPAGGVGAQAAAGAET